LLFLRFELLTLEVGGIHLVRPVSANVTLRRRRLARRCAKLL
jgi:hypothetical protein